MRCRELIFGLALALLAVSAKAADAIHPVNEYSLESWAERDGLPSARIRAIAQDADGYLWLGTDVGLVRFDGVRFVRWTSDAGTLLPEDLIVSSIHSSSDRSLWLGFADSRGIGRIRGGRLERYGSQAGVGDGSIQFLTEDQQGTMWAGDSSRIYRFREERWEPTGASVGLPETGGVDAYQDRAGNFWVSTNNGVFRRRPGQEQFEVLDRSARAVRFSDDSTGRMWITDPAHGFAALGVAEQPNAKDRSGSGLSIAHDQTDAMWIGTRGQGLWRVQRDSASPTLVTQQITVTEGLSSNIVRAVFEDRQGNVWVGTEEGLHRFTARKFRPLTNAFSWAAQATPDGSVWVATLEGLLQFVGGNQKKHTLHDGLPSEAIRALFTDARGTLWVATDGGVARRTHDRFEPFPLGDGDVSPITSIAADTHGNVWISKLRQGAFVWADGRLKPVAPPSGSRGEAATFVYVDRRDRAWLGYEGGTVAVIEQGGRTVVHQLGDAIGLVLTSVFEDKDGAVWVGGTRGLGRIRDGNVDVVAQPTRLPGYGIVSITQDTDGYVWLGVNSGVIRLGISEFEHAARQPQYRLKYQFYDESDGLVGVLRRQGFPGATRAADGTLWFVTSRGMSVIQPHEMQDVGDPPAVAVKIERASADNRIVSLSPGAVLQAGTSRLLLEYTALNLTSPMKERFFYRLEGIDDEWVDAGARREAFYSNLRSGAYRFQVARLTNEGVPSTSAAWEFSIRPMFYETWWFVCGLIAASLGLVGAAWRVRLRQLRRQFALVFGERARMSRELHDTLLQDLIGVSLHLNELGASLKSVFVPEADQILGLRRYLDSTIVRAREMVWDLRSADAERVDLPSALRDIGEKLFVGKPTRFDVAVGGEPWAFSPAVEQNLLRIGREAIGNAARYANATVVQVHLDYQSESFVLEVSDDGSGFQHPGNAAEPAAGHYGFQIMKERAEQAAGQFQVQSSPGQGTRIRVVIPRS